MDLKFEKETFDLQYARLQKRIQDLDQYKRSTASLSAAFKQRLVDQQAEINEQVGRTATVKKQEQLRMRPARTTKSVAELEVLVESLKRVIEKLKTENEALRKDNAKVQGQGERIASEKALR